MNRLSPGQNLLLYLVKGSQQDSRNLPESEIAKTSYEKGIYYFESFDLQLSRQRKNSLDPGITQQQLQIPL